MGFKDKMADKWMENMDAKEREEMMNSMMDKFFVRMSPEEKSKMMEGMMSKFMSNLSPEEKADLMGKMMPSMMGGGGSPMMGMMKMMMGGRRMGPRKTGGDDCCQEAGEGGEAAEGEGPMDMCRKMMDTIGRTAGLAVYATPEVRGLFEEWAAQIEEEILKFIKESKSTDADQIAARFKLSKDSAKYFLGRLSHKGKVVLKAEGSSGS